LSKVMETQYQAMYKPAFLEGGPYLKIQRGRSESVLQSLTLLAALTHSV